MTTNIKLRPSSVHDSGTNMETLVFSQSDLFLLYMELLYQLGILYSEKCQSDCDS